MDMPTPRLDNLKKEVSYYSNKNQLPFNLENILSSNKIYTVIPCVILLLLCLIRPKFLYNDVTDKKGNTMVNFSFQKLISFWLFFSLIIVIGFFAYRYKNRR